MTDRAVPDPPKSPLPPPSVGGESIELRTSADGDTSSDTGRHSVGDAFTAESATSGTAAPAEATITSSDPLAMAGALDDAPPVFGAGDSGGKRRIGDRIFAGMSVGASGFVILLVLLIGTFLVIKSVPSIADDKVNFLTSTEFDATNLRFGIAGLLYVTVIISIIAMIIAVPVAIGVALFITQYAPHSIRKPVAYILDLLAAIPSIVYGIWGLLVLAPKLSPVQTFLSHIPIPLFDLKKSTSTIFDGGVVLAVMILPIITAISRDVFDRTPRANVEAALALGATKWEMIRMSVLPYGRAGVVSGSMLGLGRALGETIAVYLIVGTSSSFSSSIFSGGSTFASRIALGSGEFNNPKTTGAYIAAGLVLFILTFLVNSAARAIVNRKKDFV